MIKSDRQYGQIRQHLTRLNALKKGIIRMSRNYALDCDDFMKPLNAQIEQETKDLEDYKRTEGRFAVDQSQILQLIPDLPKVLIETRIALRWSLSDLGREIGVKPQNMCRYERTLYANMSLSRVMHIAKLLADRLEEKQGLKSRLIAE